MVELQDIFREYGEEYRERNKLSIQELKVMSGIEFCRTASMGAHVDKCSECEYTSISYNSCRNRHCPKCQGFAKEKWLENRKKDLLPVNYYHMVFTIPSELNRIVKQNKKVMYDILFKASAETLLELSQDQKYLGAQIGFSSILHTWGQNLSYHPHIHCIVTGGGLSFTGMYWKEGRKKFFLPVRVLSRKFRGKFLAYLTKAYYNKKIEIRGISSKKFISDLMNKLYKKEWVVYCKPPFKRVQDILEYLGRYTHRVAIANHRIKKLENGKVTFEWKDYQDKSKNKYMTLDALEFIRRYLLHVLPHKYVKIRHYGIISNRNRTSKLKVCKKWFGVRQENSDRSITTVELIKRLTGIDITLCPCCGAQKMARRKMNALDLLRPT